MGTKDIRTPEGAERRLCLAIAEGSISRPVALDIARLIARIRELEGKVKGNE